MWSFSGLPTCPWTPLLVVSRCCWVSDHTHYYTVIQTSTIFSSWVPIVASSLVSLFLPLTHPSSQQFVKTRSPCPSCLCSEQLGSFCPHSGSKVKVHHLWLVHSSPGGLAWCSSNTSGMLLPPGLCLGISHHLECFSPNILMAYPLTFFISLPKCHLLGATPLPPKSKIATWFFQAGCFISFFGFVLYFCVRLCFISSAYQCSANVC